MNYVEVFSKIYYQLDVSNDAGKVAFYIPELRDINPNKFGVHLTTIDDEHFDDSDELFYSLVNTGLPFSESLPL